MTDLKSSAVHPHYQLVCHHRGTFVGMYECMWAHHIVHWNVSIKQGVLHDDQGTTLELLLSSKKWHLYVQHLTTHQKFYLRLSGLLLY